MDYCEVDEDYELLCITLKSAPRMDELDEGCRSIARSVTSQAEGSRTVEETGEGEEGRILGYTTQSYGGERDQLRIQCDG
jgi:hypothetical protein